MAEIHVQTKKQNASGPVWLWIIIGLLIVAAAAYFVIKNKDTAPNETTTPASPTSQVLLINELPGSILLA